MLRIFRCHDIACDLKLGQAHSDLYFMCHLKHCLIDFYHTWKD